MSFKQNAWKTPSSAAKSKKPALAILSAGALLASSKANASSTNAIIEELMKVVKPIFDKVFGQMTDALTGSLKKSESEVSVSIARSVDAAIEVRKLIHNSELRDQTRVTTDYCVDEESAQLVNQGKEVSASTLVKLKQDSVSKTMQPSAGWLGGGESIYEKYKSKILTTTGEGAQLDFSQATNVDLLRNANSQPKNRSGKVPTMVKDFNGQDDISAARDVADTIFDSLLLFEEEQVEERVSSGDIRAVELTQRKLGSNSRRNVFQMAFYKQIADRTGTDDAASVYSGFESRLDQTYYNADYFDDLVSQNAPTPVYGAVLRETTFGNAIAFQLHELKIQRTAMLYTLLADEMSVSVARDASNYTAIINRT